MSERSQKQLHIFSEKAVILLIPSQKAFSSKWSKGRGLMERNHIQETVFAAEIQY